MALVKTDVNAGGSHELYLDVRGDRVYVYTAIILSELFTSPDGVTPGDPDFQIWEVTRPDRPRQVGEWGAWAELGVHPADVDDEGAFRVNFTHSVIADGAGTAYLSYWDLGTIILDVSTPSNPTFIGRTDFDVDEEGNAHSAWTGRNDRLLVQTDEDFFPFEGGGFEEAWGYTRFYDIADPANPVPLGTFEMPSTRLLPPGIGYFTVHDPKIDGNDLYLSYYSEGVVILDITDVRNPVQQAQFVPTPAADPRGLFFPGEELPLVWGVAGGRLRPRLGHQLRALGVPLGGLRLRAGPNEDPAADATSGRRRRCRSRTRARWLGSASAGCRRWRGGSRRRRRASSPG